MAQISSCQTETMAAMMVCIPPELVLSLLGFISAHFRSCWSVCQSRVSKHVPTTHQNDLVQWPQANKASSENAVAMSKLQSADATAAKQVQLRTCPVHGSTLYCCLTHALSHGVSSDCDHLCTVAQQTLDQHMPTYYCRLGQTFGHLTHTSSYRMLHCTIGYSEVGNVCRVPARKLHSKKSWRTDSTRPKLH